MPDSNPAPRPGERPEPSPGQIDPGSRATARDSGEDGEHDEYYLDVATGAVRYLHVGATIARGRGGRDTWYFLTAERDIEMPDVRAIIPRYGRHPGRDDLHLCHAPRAEGRDHRAGTEAANA